MIPEVRTDGSLIGIRLPGERVRWHYREHLETAYLLWLDALSTQPEASQAQWVIRELTADGSIDNNEARRLAGSAAICLQHDIEP